MHDRFCVLCRVYRPNSAPRLVERPQVDEGCRLRLYSHIGDVADLTLQLMNPEPIERDDRRYVRRDRKGRLTGELRRADPVAALGGVAPIRARPLQPVVSGSHTPAVPVDLDVVDLTGPARSGSVKDTLIPAITSEREVVHSRRVVVGADGPRVDETEYPVLVPRPVLDEHGRQRLVAAGDQVGYHSSATVLDQWVRDWRDRLWPDLHLPVPTVPELAAWMRVHGRVDEACNRHPDIASCAQEIRALRAALFTATGTGEPLPEVLYGSLCKTDGCDEVSQLMRMPGSEWIECNACGRLYTENEYRDWVRELTEPVMPKRGKTRKARSEGE